MRHVMNKLHNFEEMQEQIDAETERMEKQMLSAKAWYTKGEVTAQDRPQNTVLEEHLDVQRHGRFKPPPADDDIILSFIEKSIKEQSFDSPVYKQKEKKAQKPGSIAPSMQAHKSLVEDYENLFAKQNVLAREQDDPVKSQIQNEMQELFGKLDALSHLHFVPFKRTPEATVVQNKPAVFLEEAGAAVTSLADALAPEEVCAPRGEILKGPTELTVSDRRRHRKKLMRIRSKRNRKAAVADPIKNKQAALAKVVHMAHKPGSNIKIIKCR